MKKIFSAFLAMVLLTSACLTGGLCSVAAQDTEDTAVLHPFIQGGLVAYYEGTQNTREGHDTASTVWQDLVGDNDVTVVVDENNYFTEEGYHLNSVRNYFPDAIRQTVNGDSFTVELQIKDLESLGVDFNTVMNSENDHFALFRRIEFDELEFKHTPDVTRPKSAGGLEALQDCLITLTRSVDGGFCRMYVNGVLKQEVGAPTALEATNMFFGHDQATKNFIATYCAMRFYDRELSEAEVQHNAAVEGYLNIEDLYVQEGLVSLFSGVSNTKDGYVQDSAQWQDLIGENHITLSAEEGTTYFTPEGLRTTGVRHYLPDALVDVVNGETFTVELSFGDFISIGENFNTFLNSSNDAFSLYRDSQGDLLHFKFATNLIAERPRVENALEQIDNGLVTATYEVGGKCRLYVNGVLCSEVDSPSEMGANNLFIGHDEGHKLFDSTYKSIRFYDRVLTDEEIAHNADVDGVFRAGSSSSDITHITVAQPKTNISGDVAAIREVDTSDDLRAMMNLANRPAAAIYTVNADMEIVDGKGKAFTTLAEVLETTEYGVLPILRIKDTATVEALDAFMDETNFRDVCVLSADATLIAKARQTRNTLRAALDLTASLSDKVYLTKEDCVNIRRQVKKADAWVAVLPAKLADHDMVQYLYDMQIPVWVDAPDKLTRTDAYAALLSGATGIISDGTGLLLDIACNELPLYTMTRVPLNVGHRGIPSKAPENTIEGAQVAYENGANCIEIDVYLTTDGEIVVMHDPTTLRTTGVDLTVEDCSWDQLSRLTADKGYENSQYAGARIPLFDDYLNFIKDKDCRLFIEVKSTKAAIIPALRDKIEAAGLYAQCTFISFHPTQLKELRTQYPDMVGGLLCAGNLDESNSDRDMLTVMGAVGAISATLNPQYPGYGQNAIRAANLRGISVLPWTFNASSVPYLNHYLYGYAGLTGDNADQMARFLKDVTLTGLCDCISHQIGDSVKPGLELLTYGGDTKTSLTASILLLEGDDIATVKDGTITFTGNGKVTYVISHTQRNGSDYVTMYSQPVSLTVGDSDVEVPVETLPEDGETSAEPSETTDSVDNVDGESGCKSAVTGALLCLPVLLCAAGLLIRKKND